MEDSIVQTQALLRAFAQERDWEQFHSPKNLVMALAGEVGELSAHFQWLTAEQAWGVRSDPAAVRPVAAELADVASYLFRLADVLGVDLLAAVRSKVAVNEHRYPPDLAWGRADKYDRLPQE